MAVMKMDRTLRESPAGQLTGVVAKSGAKVDVLDDTTPPWTKIRLVDGAAVGWVADEAINKAADTLGPLDKSLVAKEIVEASAKFGCSPYYVAAVAGLRTDMTHNAGGLFAFTVLEWAANADQSEYGVRYRAEDLNDWRAQVTLFSIMAAEAQLRIAELLGRQPSMVELLFGQVLGSRALLAAQTEIARSELMVAAAEVAQEEGLDPANLTGRDATFLTGATSKDIMEAFSAEVTRGFEDTRGLVRTEADAFIKIMTEFAATAPVGVGDINFASSAIPNGRADMAKLIAAKFADAGYGAIQQIAAIANAIAESKLDPDAKNLSGERSFGLFQLNQKGGVGLGYSEAELRKPDDNIRIMLEDIAMPYQKQHRAAFMATTSLEQAVKIFVYQFERPREKAAASAERYGIAQQLVA